jgi:bifunctional non-homologous end joining protein LigD
MVNEALPAGHLSAERGEAMFHHACAMGLEGVVSKRATSRYRSGSCKSWLKVKNPDYGEAAVRKLGAAAGLSRAGRGGCGSPEGPGFGCTD